jgi:hypothetical protein
VDKTAETVHANINFLFLLRPVWIIGIKFHSNNCNLVIYQLN